MENELITIEQKNVLSIFTEVDQLDEIIKQVEMEVMSFEHDLSNDARRKKTASLANKVARTKTYLDGLGKDLVSDWKNKAKIVDANRKQMRDRLDELKAIARNPLTEWEEEQARIKAEEEARIAAEKLREEVERDHELALLINSELDRKAEEAAKAEAKAEQLRLKAEEKVRLEREAKIAEEAKIKAEQEAKEREERLIREAKEREEAIERERLAAIEREREQERQRIAAEERAKTQAEEAAERARLAEIQRQRDEEERQRKEQEAREANKRHIGIIRKSAKESIMALGIGEKKAKELVMAIHNGHIANVKINY